MRSSAHPPIDEDRIVSEYLGGVGVRELSRLHHAETKTISRILAAHGVAGTLVARSQAARRGVQQPGNRRASRLRADIPDTTWAYVAGLFDGEGNLSPGPVGSWRLSIAQLERTGLCRWIQETLGIGTVTVHRGARANPMENFRVGAHFEVRDFLLGVEPYVRVKREVALRALADLRRTGLLP